ncbi:DUF3886 domain-containing protein [Brevibacillus massiliensis]|jgi:hypothetical protein|uniref:DUF3886 domain-containing protein n=1 Tax=Brevibacillus massiliensis TaxID=1118054 RepID=UPI0002FE2A98|nr:DUF3886 domain-containing protein [Brevibacillus massiliensis]
MAKKPKKQQGRASAAPMPEQKAGQSLKDLLGDEALAKLKQVERELKTAKQEEEAAEAERRRRELAEKEKNKSFAELLAEYDKKGGGKYS